jgi:hypothetical protein
MTDQPDSVARKLHSTTDVVIWAEEFCRTFDGWTVVNENDGPAGVVDQSLMISWFANAMQAALTHDRERGG